MSDNDHDHDNETKNKITNERPPEVDAPELVLVMEGYTAKDDNGKHKES